ncbi:MAG: hypothetical protein SVM86_01160 [Candidatus Cloacimonadota bacterium]|nr:hypothetical protein [Candidatus Cloacimonadota bacterium]
MFLKRLSIFFIIFLLTNCTDKENPIGINEGPQPIETTISDTSFFGNFFSYQDSLKSYNSSNKIIVGNYDDIEVKSLIKFQNLPDTLNSLTDEFFKLTLVNKDSLNFSRQLKFGKILQPWKENFVTWKAATDSTDWETEFFTEIDFQFDVATWQDSTIINIPYEYFYTENEEQLIVDNEVAENGFIIFCEENDNNGYVEFFSKDSDSKPYLSFDYTIADSDSIFSYNENLKEDAILYEKIDGNNTEFPKYEDTLMIKNIPPVKIYMNLDLSFQNLIDKLNDIDSEDDLRRMTVNKAELILYKAEEEQFEKRTLFSLRPYVLTNESATTPFNYFEDYDYLSYSNDSFIDSSEDKYNIDITNIIQQVLAGEIDFNGLIFRSTNEGYDFEFIKFANKYSDVDLQPKLRIIYTPPFLDE